MKLRGILFTVTAACFAFSALPLETRAYSDWVGIYARIDRVVLEPGTGAPDRIQIWGAFALANKTDRDSYEPAQRGYLYYSLAPGKEEVCRREWADLKSIAGTDQIIGFGARNMERSRLRKADDKPASPDVYPVGSGLVKMNDRHSDYGPIRDLRSLPKGQR